MRLGALIETTELLQQAGRLGDGIDRTEFLVLEPGDGGGRKLNQTAAVGGGFVAGMEGFLLSLGKIRRGDLVDFHAELFHPVFPTAGCLKFLKLTSDRRNLGAAGKVGLAFGKCLAEAVDQERLLPS